MKDELAPFIIHPSTFKQEGFWGKVRATPGAETLPALQPNRLFGFPGGKSP